MNQHNVRAINNSVQIVLIDIVMAADNAIIIGLIAANFAPDNRKKIIAGC